MLVRLVHTLNSQLRALTLTNSSQKALVIYNQMLQNSLFPDNFTFIFSLKACSLLLSLQKGKEIHCRIMKSGHSSDHFVQSSLVRFYAVSGDLPAALQIFAGISEPDVVSWNSMIAGFSHNGHGEQALLAFGSMNMKPSSGTAVSILTAISQLRDLKLGKGTHAYSLKNFGGTNIILENAILDMYLKCGCSIVACQVFDKMPMRDVVSWTTMVSGFAQNGCFDEATRVFYKMVKEGEVKPNEATLMSTLSAISSLGALSLGRWVHLYMDANHFSTDGLVGNALVNMYAKCGDMDTALRVFDGLTSKDVVSWSTIIGGMAMNGCGMYALQLFSRMLCHGLHPDAITFIGVLSACSHAGLVDQGSLCFRVMRDVYGIEARMEHYACMVDLYGRAGLIEEAETFIRNMTIEPDGQVWGALLNACRIHGNEEMCNRVGQHLMVAKSASGGTYALLSNMYARADKWLDANNIRKFMKLKGIRKIPGCSWIEVEDTIHGLEVR